MGVSELAMVGVTPPWNFLMCLWSRKGVRKTMLQSWHFLESLLILADEESSSSGLWGLWLMSSRKSASSFGLSNSSVLVTLKMETEYFLSSFSGLTWSCSWKDWGKRRGGFCITSMLLGNFKTFVFGSSFSSRKRLIKSLTLIFRLEFVVRWFCFIWSRKRTCCLLLNWHSGQQ